MGEGGRKGEGEREKEGRKGVRRKRKGKEGRGKRKREGRGRKREDIMDFQYFLKIQKKRGYFFNYKKWKKGGVRGQRGGS